MPNQTQATLAEIQSAESQLLLQTYERNPILFLSGNGVHLRDEHGNDYLDLLSGIGVCGARLQTILRSPTPSLLRRPPSSSTHPTPLPHRAHGRTNSALRLTEIHSPALDRASSSRNSGTEAWEAALKPSPAPTPACCVQKASRSAPKSIALEHIPSTAAPAGLRRHHAQA